MDGVAEVDGGELIGASCGLMMLFLYELVVLSSSVVRDEGRFIVEEVWERARRRPGEAHSAFRQRSKLFCEVVAFDRLSLRTSCSLRLRIV